MFDKKNKIKPKHSTLPADISVSINGPYMIKHLANNPRMINDFLDAVSVQNKAEGARLRNEVIAALDSLKAAV